MNIDIIKQIDHIVYGVPNLEQAVELFQSKYGVTPTIGGKHLTKGTHNALIKIGHKCYLEILASDKTNEEIKAPRWMGIDLINSPKITRLCLNSNQIQKDGRLLKEYHSEMGELAVGERKTPSEKMLSWKMTLPLPFPEVELLPFFIDWSKSESHPTDQLKQMLEIKAIQFYHPNPSVITPYLNRMFPSLEIIKAKDIQITASFKGPNGLFEI